MNLHPSPSLAPDTAPQAEEKSQARFGYILDKAELGVGTGDIREDEWGHSNVEGCQGELLTQLHVGGAVTHQEALQSRHWGLPETELPP